MFPSKLVTMKLCARKQHTINPTDSCTSDAELLQRQNLSFSQTSKLSRDNAQNYEHILDECNVLMENMKKLVPQYSQKNHVLQDNSAGQISLSAELKPENFLNVNYSKHKGINTIFNCSSKNASSDLSIFYDNRRSDKVDSETSMSSFSNTLSNRFAGRIHKSPIERQCSTDLDISLGDSSKVDHKLIGRIKKSDHCVHTENLHPTLTQKQNDLDLHQQPEQQKLHCSRMSTKTSEKEQIDENGRWFNERQETNVETYPSDYEKSCVQQCNGSTSNMVSSKQINNHTESAYSNKKTYSFNDCTRIDDCTRFDESTRFDHHGPTSQGKDINGFDKETSKSWSLFSVNRQGILINVMCVTLFILALGVLNLYRRVEAIEVGNNLSSNVRCQCRQDSQIFNKNQVDTGSTQTMTEDMHTQIMQYLPSDDQETLSDGTNMLNVLNNVNNHNPNEEPVHRKDNRNKTHAENRHLSITDHLGNMVTDNSRTVLRPSLSKSLKNGTLFKTGLKDISLSDKLGTKENVANISQSEDNTFSPFASIQIIELPNHSQDATDKLLSRVIRSNKLNNKGKIVNDPAFSSTRKNKETKKQRIFYIHNTVIKQCLCGYHFVGSAKALKHFISTLVNNMKSNNRFLRKMFHGASHFVPKVVHQAVHRNKMEGGPNSSSQVESFEVRYSEIFVYRKHFLDKGTTVVSDCTVQHEWGRGIKACKDATVHFSHQNTLLPFYNATNATAGKDHKKRMILNDNQTPGEFHVNVSGDYLVQLNITVVDNMKTLETTSTRNNENYFLALFLNGQAMLACQQGGFRCPHLNHHASSKYKICNIIGLLELKKGDIMDIRTMEPNITVRMENLRKSYFRVVLLSKIK